MPLTSGTRIGPYEISGQIGVGGMGEVYRATDANLGRPVAIKVLPEALAHDPDRLARLEREARTLALLNHPHIAHVYGLERDGDRIALVMELVEGPTIADMIPRERRPLPLDEALSIARQIAEALEAAHEQGIIHRDLKPANIKVRPDGAVKVLDFGLARAAEPAAAVASGVSAPTITTPAMTQMGVILGTAAYMSPEQARGKPVDKRTDIWAFGCVLYEMLTGRRAFDGDDTTEVLARVIERDVDLTAVPGSCPPSIRRLLKRCLEKDRNRRLTDIGVARLEIDEARSAPSVDSISTTGADGPAKRGRPVVERLVWASALVVVAAGAAWIGYARRPVAPTAPEVRFDIPITPVRFGSDLAISPDGRRIAYVAALPDGRAAIWLRSLENVNSEVLAGTEELRPFPMSPAWSPDGRQLAFVQDGALKKIDVGGGAAQVLAKVDGQPGGATWSRDDVIVFASNDHGLRRVNASGGPVTNLTERDQSLDELFHDAPQFLPDGRHLLYLAWSAGKPASRAVYLASLDSTARTKVMDAESNAFYTQGQLLFMQGDTLMARPFNPDRAQFTGEARALVQGVPKDGGELGHFAVSESGALIYRAGQGQSATRQLVWFDRGGKSERVGDATFQAAGLRLSPDGRQIAFLEGANNTDIWLYDLTRNVRTRFTTDAAPDHAPIWSPDGSRIVFDSHRWGDQSASALYEKPSNGAVPEKQILDKEDGWQHSPRDWAADGSSIVFAKVGGSAVGWNLWVLPLAGDRKPFPYRSGNFNENEAAIAPNGQWLAFTSNEAGSPEVIVQSFPDPSRGRWQISSGGGSSPRWRRDGKELFYLDTKGRMMAVAVNTQGQFSIQGTTALFQTPLPLPIGGGGAAGPFEVAAEGQKFLMLVPLGQATTQPITVRLNWLARGAGL